MELVLTKTPIAEAGMWIRKPAHEVYAAFVDPIITTQFWFTKSSGKLEVGKRIRWEWEMYGATTTVAVKQLEIDKRILLDWNVDDRPNSVEWTFTPSGPNATFVSIKNYGFEGDGDEIVAQAMDSEAGFAWVLASLKTYLEHGINLNLIGDRFPERIKNQPTGK
jgi:uncharacterized protein YndB with AHSA1/START domain